MGRFWLCMFNFENFNTFQNEGLQLKNGRKINSINIILIKVDFLNFLIKLIFKSKIKIKESIY